MKTWREFDTLDGIDPRKKVTEFQKDKAMFDTIKKVIEIRGHLEKLVYAQQRMLEKWAEGDENVKNDLWKNLHDAGNNAKNYLTYQEE